MKKITELSIINLFNDWRNNITKSLIIASIALLASSGIMPLLFPSQASAAQLTSRSITLGGAGASPTSGASKASKTDVTYRVTATIGTTGNIGGVVVDFCSNSPVIGISCTAPTGFDTNKASLAIANQSGVTGLSVDTTNSTTNKVVLTRTAGSISSGAVMVFDLGSSGATDGMTNPSANCDANTAADECTFYARILTYAASATAQSYTSASPGAYVDGGGVAMSTANQLTITARVQEVLHFCVGTSDSGVNDDCRDLSGNSIDLGVVDSSAISTTAASAGKAELRTNASSGATVSYFAEQNTSSGKLKVTGASCTGTSTTDQCFNSAGTTATAFTAGTEKFGMTCTNVDTTNGTTSNVTRDAQYSGTTTYAWDDTGATDLIASSSTVVDDELLDLKFAATAASTTPTGAYTVTATFIATATY